MNTHDSIWKMVKEGRVTPVEKEKSAPKTKCKKYYNCSKGNHNAENCEVVKQKLAIIKEFKTSFVVDTARMRIMVSRNTMTQ